MLIRSGYVRVLAFMVLLATAAVPGVSARMAELMDDGSDMVRTTVSDNGRYEVSVRSGGGGFVTWSLKEDGNELWSQLLENEPAEAVVSDNGETIVLPLWGWRDEGGSKGIGVYDKKGDLVREILFKGERPADGMLKWVKVTKVSPDGKHVAIAEGGKDASMITLFNAMTGDVVWVASGGYPDPMEIAIAKDGTYVLVATHKVSDMEVVLYDRAGTPVWSKKIERNHSYEVPRYLAFTEDGGGFRVFDLKTGQYLTEELPGVGQKNGK